MSDPSKIDANQLLQDWNDERLDENTQRLRVERLLNEAEPYVLILARMAERMQVAPKVAAVKKIARLLRDFPHDEQVSYMRLCAKAAKEDLNTFKALMKPAKNEDEDGDNYEIIETIGPEWIQLPSDPTRGWLIDYVYKKNIDKAYLVVRNPEGEVSEVSHVDVNGRRYIPKVDELIRQGIVEMPSGLGPLMSTKELIDIHTENHRRSILLDNPLNYWMCGFYSVFSWLFDAFAELPFMRFQGDKDTGKSAAALRVGYLCYRMAKSTGISTTASLKYAASTYHATMFMDEMDVSDQFDERIVLLNVSAMKNQAFIWQMQPVKLPDGQTVFEPIVHNVYGPKIITMYGSFADPATESRCITFKMYEKEVAELKRKGIPRRLNDAWYARALEIRNMSLTWRMHNWQPNITEIPEELEDDHVSTRVNQVTVPIKYLVKDDPEALAYVTKVVRAIYGQQLEERSRSFEARILEAILRVLEDPRFMILGFVQVAETRDYGHTRFVRYPDLGKVANFLIDEMNTGKEKDVSRLLKDETEEEAEQESGKGKKKKSDAVIKSKTIGDIVNKDLRLPTQRMGSGYVVIVESSLAPDMAQDRMEVLRLKYGLENYAPMPDTPAEELYAEMAEKEPDW